VRIAVVNLTGGGLSGGYQKYLAHLMPLLARDARVNALDVFVPPRAVAAFSGGDIRVSTWPEDDSGRGYTALKRRLAEGRPDVIFIPTARHLDCGSTPLVTMVRNMEPLLVPFNGNPWRVGFKNLARAWEAKRAARRARRVIAVSTFVRDFVVERWHIDDRNVGVVYHGSELSEAPATSAGDALLTGPFLFTAGSIRPARGLEDAIRALALLNEHGRWRLVIAGREDPGTEAYGSRLRQLARELQVDSGVVWAGQLGEGAMRAAFERCAAFVMTSRAEACPNTVLEAMTYGCASVSVDHAPMPEFYAESALYYRAGQSAHLAEQLRVILDTDPPAADRLRAAARRRAADFTWRKTSDRTLRELERALA
jgi:glycosyltransferase involved in cell wall biosynthesis